MAFIVDFGHGYRAVPYDSVCVNGLYLSQLNVADDSFEGPYALQIPECKDLGQRAGSAMGEDGYRPYLYGTLDECRDDATTLQRLSRQDKARRLTEYEVIDLGSSPVQFEATEHGKFFNATFVNPVGLGTGNTKAEAVASLVQSLRSIADHIEAFAAAHFTS